MNRGYLKYTALMYMCVSNVMIAQVCGNNLTNENSNEDVSVISSEINNDQEMENSDKLINENDTEKTSANLHDNSNTSFNESDDRLKDIILTRMTQDVEKSFESLIDIIKALDFKVLHCTINGKRFAIVGRYQNICYQSPYNNLTENQCLRIQHAMRNN